METRTFEVKCYLCSSQCFLSSSSRSAYPAALCPPESWGLVSGVGGSGVLFPCVCASAAPGSPKVVVVVPETSGSDIGPRLCKTWRRSQGEKWMVRMPLCQFVWFVLPSRGGAWCAFPSHTHSPGNRPQLAKVAQQGMEKRQVLLKADVTRTA